jgi:hypothetical protein
LTASLLGVFLFGEHIQTDAAGPHQAAPGSAAGPAPVAGPPADPADQSVPGGQARRPPALNPDRAVRAGRTRPGPARAAARAGSGSKTLIPVRAAA